MGTNHLSAISHRLIRLAEKFRDKAYRDSYVGATVRRFVAQQIRALRGDLSQADFGHLLEKPQSVVSRLEDPAYGKLTIQTLLDIAAKLDRALIVQFVDYPTFMKFSGDFSELTLAPVAYDSASIDKFSRLYAIFDSAVASNNPIKIDAASSDSVIKIETAKNYSVSSVNGSRDYEAPPPVGITGSYLEIPRYAN